MLATPLRVRDVVFAHQAFIASRMFTTALVYFVVIAAFGAVSSPLGVLSIPVAVLVGLAYSTFIAAWGAHTENEASFVAIFRFGILPMFLFSGTFFPIDRLPAVLEVLAYVTPLWHGVDLCRMLVLGDVVGWLALLHVAYLLAWVAGGLALALFSYRRRLVV
jgi:lipooligosaccharide transport system permease protein